MFTITRFNKIRKYYGLNPVNIVGHDEIEEVDAVSDFNTKWEDGHVCACKNGAWSCAGNHNFHNTVGARVALHERLIAATSGCFGVKATAPPFFWLGKEAMSAA